MQEMDGRQQRLGNRSKIVRDTILFSVCNFNCLRRPSRVNHKLRPDCAEPKYDYFGLRG